MTTLNPSHKVSYLLGSSIGHALASDLTPVKAIRLKCLDCSGGSYSESRLCPIPSCPLYPYRLGHRPKFDSEAVEGHVATDSCEDEVEEDGEDTDLDQDDNGTLGGEQ